MNETIKTLLNRRSHRTFLQDEIKKDELDAIIEAGLYSPSAMNQQPWHFAVVTNQELLDELSFVSKEVAKKSGNEYIEKLANNEKFHIFYNAPVAVIVSVEQGKYEAEIDCAAATENMLLAAESFDIGSCWIGFVSFLFKGDEEKAKEYSKKLNIPKGYMPSHAVVLGYKKNKDLKAPARRENTVSYVK